MGFQEDLEKSVLQADPNINREELLEDIFKSFVAKMFEFVLSRGKSSETRLPAAAVIEIKNNLINEFRQASLEKHQKPVEWYEELFDKTVGEIFTAAKHQGEDLSHIADHQLEINMNAYKHEGGLFIPKSSGDS
jgi:hypothetical protein